MRKLILDMSQALINRTAMYTISFDTFETLRDSCSKLQLFGETVPLEADLSEFGDKAGRLYRLLDDIGEGYKPPYHAPISDALRTLYLDPLYTMLAPLNHDDAVMLLDLSPATNPEWHGTAVARAYRFAFELIARERPLVLAISENTAECFRTNYGFPADRIKVIPLYLPRHHTKQAVPTYAVAPYILFVGSLEARKNLLGAIEIFRLSGLAARGYEFLVVGGRGHGADQVESLAARTPGVRLAGFVTNDQLASLYAGAAAFLYPSYLEGFGVPLLEALAAGLPCVASFTGAIPEVGGDAVRYADPDDHAGFATALVEAVALNSEDRDAVARRGKARVESNFRFSHYQSALRAALEIKG
jgi:glycosyltransferase involved in cell wall biosynthesis